ncbi:breast cancer type 2 susceptibility protein-like [Haliotis asinina]|uniref:breast cancer type 2 susceptibility protein-like n=1 Tax=Haliotis asinina TaxID=109174 RepID=UPI003532686B
MDAAVACACPSVDVTTVVRRRRRKVDISQLEKGGGNLSWFEDLTHQAQQKLQHMPNAATPRQDDLHLAGFDSPSFLLQPTELVQATTPGRGSLTPLSAWALLNSQDPSTSTPTSADHPNVGNSPCLLSPPDVESCLKTCGISEQLGLVASNEDSNMSWTNSMATPCLGGELHTSQKAEEAPTPPKPKGFPRALFSPDQGRTDSDELVKELNATMEEEGLSGVSPGPSTSMMVQTDRRKNFIKELFLRSTGQNQEMHEGGSPQALHPLFQTAQSTATPRASCKKHQRGNFSNIAVNRNITSPLVKDDTSPVSKTTGHKTAIDIENEDVRLKINILQMAASFNGDISSLPTDDVVDNQVVSDTEIDVVNHLTNSNQIYQGKRDEGNYTDSSKQRTSSTMLNRRVRNSQEQLKQKKRLSSDLNVTQSVVNEALSIFIDSPSSAEVRRRTAPRKGKKRKSTEACLPEGDVDGALFSTPSPHGSQAIKPHSILSSSKKRKHGSGKKKVRFAENLCEGEGVGANKKLNYDQWTDTDTSNVCSSAPKVTIELTSSDSLMLKEPDLSGSVKPDDKTCALFQPEDNKSVQDNCSSPQTDGHNKNLKEKATQFVQNMHVSLHADDKSKIFKEVCTESVQEECVGLHADSSSGTQKEKNNKLVRENHISPHPVDSCGNVHEKGIGPVKDKHISPHSAEPTDGEQPLFESQPDEQFQLEICQSNIISNIQADFSCKSVLNENNSDESHMVHSDQLTCQSGDFLSSPSVTKVLSETEQSPVQAAADSLAESMNNISVPNPSGGVCESSVSTPVRPLPAVHDEMFSQISPSSLSEMCLVASSDQSKLHNDVDAQEPFCSSEAHEIDVQEKTSDVITDSAALYQHSIQHVDQLVKRTSSAQTFLPQAQPRAATSSDGSSIKCPDKGAVSVPTENDRSSLSQLPRTDMQTSTTDIIASKGEVLKSSNLTITADRSSCACTGHTDVTEPYVQNLFTKKPKAKRFFYPTSSQIRAVCPKTVFSFKGCDVDAKVSATVREAEPVASAASCPNVDNTSVINVVEQNIDCAPTGSAGVAAVAGVGVDATKDGAAAVKEADVLQTDKDTGIARNTVADPPPPRDKKGTMTKEQDFGLTKFSEMFDESLIDWEDWDSVSQTAVLPGKPTSMSAVLPEGELNIMSAEFPDGELTSKSSVFTDGKPISTSAALPDVELTSTSAVLPDVELTPTSVVLSHGVKDTISEIDVPADIGERRTTPMKAVIADVDGDMTSTFAVSSAVGGETASKTAKLVDVGGEIASDTAVSPDSSEHMTSKTDVPAEGGLETTFQAAILTHVGGLATFQQAVQNVDTTSQAGVLTDSGGDDPTSSCTHNIVRHAGEGKIGHVLPVPLSSQKNESSSLCVQPGNNMLCNNILFEHGKDGKPPKNGSQMGQSAVSDAVKQNASVVHELYLKDDGQEQIKACCDVTSESHWLPSSQYVHNLVKDVQEELFSDIEFSQVDSVPNETTDVRTDPEVESCREVHDDALHSATGNKMMSNSLSEKVLLVSGQCIESEVSVRGSNVSSATEHQLKDVFKKPDVPGKDCTQKALVFSDSDTDAMLSDMDLSETHVKDKGVQLDSSVQGCHDMSSTDASDFESCKSESDVKIDKKFNVNQSNCAADSPLSDSDTDLYVTSTEEIKEWSPEVKHQTPRNKISAMSRTSRKDSVLLSRSLIIGDSDSDVNCERIVYKNRKGYHFEMLPKKKEPKLVNESDPDILWSGLESHRKDVTTSGQTDGTDCHKDIQNIRFASDAEELRLKRDQTDTNKMGNESLALQEAKSPASVTMKDDNKQKPDKSNRARSTSGSESVWSDLEQGEAEILKEETVGVSFVTEKAETVTVSSVSHQFVAVDEEVQIKTVLKDERPETGNVRLQAESQGSMISLSQGISSTNTSNLPLMNIDSEQSILRVGEFNNQESARPPVYNLDCPQGCLEHAGVKLPFAQDQKSLQKVTDLLESDADISEDTHTSFLTDMSKTGFSTASGKKFSFDPKSLQNATALLETDVNISKGKHNTEDNHNLSENDSSKGMKHAVAGFSTASGKKFSFDSESLQKATTLLETDVLSERTNVSKHFSKCENVNSPNISRNVVSGFSTASGKKFNFDPESLQKATSLLEIDVDMSEIVDTNQGKVIPGNSMSKSNSHPRRHKTYIDIADVTASCVKAAESDIPSFATASGKHLFLNKDALVKAQTLMELEEPLVTDIPPNNQKFKRIPDQSSSKAASDTVPVDGCELESMLEDFLKSKKSTLKKQSKDSESQSDNVNPLSRKSLAIKRFEDVLQTSADIMHQPKEFHSPSPGFSAAGKKGLQIVSNNSIKKGDPMLKPKGFRPFKKPRIVPKPKILDRTSKQMEVDSPKTSSGTTGGGQPSGRLNTPGDSTTKENTDSELCDMMLLEFTGDMTELSQGGFQTSAPKDPYETCAERLSQADDTVESVAVTNTMYDRDNGTESNQRVNIENYVSCKLSSSNENHKAVTTNQPCDSYKNGKIHNIKSSPFSTASGRRVSISEEALMSARSLMDESNGNTADCQALLEEELFRGDMSSQLYVRAAPAGMERMSDGCHEASADVSDSGRATADPEPDASSVGVLSDARLKGTGFHTASGKQMCLSEDSLTRAKAMWDDIPISDTKTNAASEENATISRKMLNVCSVQDHVVPNICNFDSKCEGKDTEVYLRTESTVALSTSIDEDTLTLSSGNKNLVARDVFDEKMTLNPFQTASGKVVSVSSAALNQARKVMSECRDVAEVPRVKSISYSSDVKHMVKLYKEDDKSMSSLFQNASGKGVTVLESSLSATKKTFSEDFDSKPLSLFQTASGKGVTVSESSLSAAKKTLSDDFDSKPLSLLQTASGKGVTVSESSLLATKKTLSEDFDSKPLSLFQTASGKGVAVSESSLSAARKTLSEDFDSKPLSLLQTASGKGVAVSESSLSAARKTLSEDFDSKPPSLFQTASGKGVTVDKQSLVEAKKLMKDTHETQLSTTLSTSLFQRASGNAVTVSESALVKSKEMFTDEQTSLFKTASGSSVTVSSNSLDQAKTIFNESVDDTSTESSNLISSAITALGGNVFSEHNAQHTSNVFQTASASAVGVSANVVVGAQRQDDHNSSAVISKSLLQASGSCVGVSTVAQGKRLLGEAQEPPTALVTSGHGFHTASGRGVLVAESLLGSSRKLVNEASEDSVVPEVRQTESHDQLLTSDGQRRFGHRSRSKTPVVSSPESMHLDRLVKEGRRLQPIMSTSLSTTPRFDDYDLDGILNKSSEKRTTNTTSSFKTPYKNTAFVTPVRKASDQDKHTSGNSSKTPVFYPRASLRANQKQSRNSPTNHSKGRLELDRHDSCATGPSTTSKTTGSKNDNTDGSQPSITSSKSGEDISGRASSMTMGESSGDAMNTDGGQQQCKSDDNDLPRPHKGCVGIAEEGLMFQRGKIGSTHSKEIASASIDSNHQLEEARQKQGEIIQRKKKQKVCPSCGRHFSEKQSAGMRLQYRDLMVEGSLSDQELCSIGVRQEILDISSISSEDFRFNLLLYYPNMKGSVLVGDGAHLIPDNSGFAGKEEFYRSFISLKSVDPALVSDIWVYNHYRWIVWKLAAYETSYPAQFSGRCLTPNNVMLQLKYRYDREIDRCHRSALKKIVERDDAACKRLVLCVSEIKKHQSGPDTEGAGQYVVELTDGWYCIKAQLDVGLAQLVATKKISIGQKICVSGAELTGSQEACPPLEIPESLYLKMCMNSTRPAPGDSKLGYQRDPRPLCVPIRTLHADGGMAGCVDIVVTRIYPVMYMEKLVEGGTIFRTEDAEERMQRQFDRHKQDKMEKLYIEIQAGLEKDLGRGRRKSRKRWSQREVQDLQTGQEIYDAVEGSLQPEEVHSWLSEHQAQMMDSHRRQLQDLQHQQLQDKLHTAWEEAQQGHTSRNVTPVLKLRVSGCAKRDIDAKISSIVTVWRPSSEWLHLVEGKRYKIYGLIASSAKTRLDSHSVHLTANRQTKLQPRPVDENYLDLVYDQREVWSVKDLRSRSPPFKEFDFVGMVITSKSNSQRSCDTVYISDIDGEILSISFWRGLQSFGLEDHLVAGKSIVATNLILKWSRGSGPVSADACSEVTRFSSMTKMSDHRKYLARFTSFKQAEKNKFLAAAREKLSEHERKSQAPQTQLATPEKYFSDIPSECLQKLFSPMDDQGEKLSKGDNSATPDHVVKKRRSILREKSAKLMAYGSPHPLSPISCPISPAVARAFKLPSGLAKNMKNSFN